MTISENRQFLEELAQDALRAFHAGDSNWRVKWSLLFVNLASSEKDEQDGLGAVFAYLAGLFGDLENGARNPLGERAVLPHRPPAHFFQRDRNAWIAAVCAAELASENGKVRQSESTFRTVSSYLRAAGANVTWREVRSAWNNRKRQGYETLIAELVDPIAGPDFDVEAYVRLIQIAAHMIQSEPHLF